MSDLRDGTCPKCQHNRVLHITQLADRVGESGGGRVDHGTDTAPEVGQFYPWRIARLRNPDGNWVESHVRAAGLVQAFACARCGFTELYTQRPDLIPVDGSLVREIVAPASAGPFR